MGNPETSSSIILTQTNQTLQIEIRGKVDEFLDFPNLKNETRTIEINLESLTYINSYGVGRWVNWLKQATLAKQIVIEKAPPSIVRNFVLVNGFLPRGTHVRSVFAPYLDPDTFEEQWILTTFGTHFDKNGVIFVPEVKTKDGRKMEPDFNPKKYFEFLK